jgi:hypothetical protein
MPRYLILGPADQDQLPMFWSKEHGGWVDRDSATLYGQEIFLFPPRELPVGGVGILDIENGLIYTPRPSCRESGK